MYISTLYLAFLIPVLNFPGLYQVGLLLLDCSFGLQKHASSLSNKFTDISSPKKR